MIFKTYRERRGPNPEKPAQFIVRQKLKNTSCPLEGRSHQLP